MLKFKQIIVVVVMIFILNGCYNSNPAVTEISPTESPEILMPTTPTPTPEPTPAETPQPTPLVTISPVDFSARNEELVQLFEDNKEYYTVKSTEFGGYSADGGYVTGYYHDDELIKIYVEFWGESGQAHETMYLDEDYAYIHREEIYYKVPYYIDPTVEIVRTDLSDYVIYEESMFMINDEDGESTIMSSKDYVQYTQLINDCINELDEWGNIPR